MKLPGIQEYGTIVQGDCVDIMKSWPDKCVDLVLTDFPYGIGEEYLSFHDTQENLTRLISAAMPQILRIAKRALITCGVKNIWRYPKPAWILNWTRPAGTGKSPWGFCCWSPILAYGQDPYLTAGAGARPDTFVHTEISEKNGHPCPKPIGIWKKLLLRGSNKITDVVCDPFMGSGTTALACIEHARPWIGIEIEPAYCDIARKRIAAEGAQGKLFAVTANED